MQQAGEKKPPGRPKGEQAENAARRRLQLIEAAIDSIATYGMSATTLATVAKAAGLSQGVAVFYFKSKENLLIETLRHHYTQYQALWQAKLAEAPDDPVEQLAALVFTELDPQICNPRFLALWNSFWGETVARPRFAELCDSFDRERHAVMLEICERAAPLMAGAPWEPATVSDVLDTLTDGMWTRMHISPGSMDARAGRRILACLMATIFPGRRDQIMARAAELSSR